VERTLLYELEIRIFEESLCRGYERPLEEQRTKEPTL